MRLEFASLTIAIFSLSYGTTTPMQWHTNRLSCSRIL